MFNSFVANTKNILSILKKDSFCDDQNDIVHVFIDYIVPMINLDLIKDEISIANLIEKINEEINIYLLKNKIETHVFLDVLTNYILKNDASSKIRYKLCHALLLTVIKRNVSQKDLINNINDNLVGFLNYFNHNNNEEEINNEHEEKNKNIEIFNNVFLDAIKNTTLNEIKFALPSLKIYIAVIKAAEGNKNITRISVALPPEEKIFQAKQVTELVDAIRLSAIESLDLTNISITHEMLMLLILSIHKKSNIKVREIIFGKTEFNTAQLLEFIEVVGLSTIEILDLTNINMSAEMLMVLIKDFSNESSYVRRIVFDEDKFKNKLEIIKDLYGKFKKYAILNQHKKFFIKGLHEMADIFTSGKSNSSTSDIKFVISLLLQIDTNIENNHNDGIDYFQYYCQAYHLLKMIPGIFKDKAHIYFYDKLIKILFEIVFQYSEINQELYRKAVKKLVSVFHTISVDEEGISKVAVAIECLASHPKNYENNLKITVDIFKILLLGSLKPAKTIDKKISGLPAKELQETILMATTFDSLIGVINIILKTKPIKSIKETLEIYKRLMSGIELNAGHSTQINDNALIQLDSSN